MPMKLSFILPIYNVEEYLDNCLQSLYCQDIDISDFEVICIDDGSTDHSLAKAKAFAKKYPNILIKHRENRGGLVEQEISAFLPHPVNILCS